MRDSKIEWTDDTWNPVRGCNRTSPGCENCYAELMAARFSQPGQWAHGFAKMTPSGPRWTGKMAVVMSHLQDPIHWRLPRRIFVNSMSDLFHEGLKDHEIDLVFGVMAACYALGRGHTFQVLTKRAERMSLYFKAQDLRYRIARAMAMHIENADQFFDQVHAGDWWPLPNVHLGVSVESEKYAVARLPFLEMTPAAVRFLSCEPLLGPIKLCEWFKFGSVSKPGSERFNWIIVGGESGPGARPCEVDWIREIIRDCRLYGVPVFVKQLGAKPMMNYYDDFRQVWMETFADDWPDPIGHDIERDGQPPLDAKVILPLNDSKGGDMSEWPEDLRVREFPEVKA